MARSCGRASAASSRLSPRPHAESAKLRNALAGGEVPDPAVSRYFVRIGHRYVGRFVHHVREEEQCRGPISRGSRVIRRAGERAEYIGLLNFPGARRVEENGRLHPRDVLEIVDTALVGSRWVPGVARGSNTVRPLLRRLAPTLIDLDQRQVIAGLQAIYQTVQQLLRFVHLRFGSATGDVDSHDVGVSLNGGLATNRITAATSSEERTHQHHER